QYHSYCLGHTRPLHLLN
ncbi:hypothetical protein D043_0317B, partial [Vibrio parahaemolyticus EKP-021]